MGGDNKRGTLGNELLIIACSMSWPCLSKPMSYISSAILSGTHSRILCLIQWEFCEIEFIGQQEHFVDIQHSRGDITQVNSVIPLSNIRININLGNWEACPWIHDQHISHYLRLSDRLKYQHLSHYIKSKWIRVSSFENRCHYFTPGFIYQLGKLSFGDTIDVTCYLHSHGDDK